MRLDQRVFRRRHFASVFCAILPFFGAVDGLAASTEIADVPLVVKNSVKPNIMFILDNSGSMDWRSITGSDGMGPYQSSNIDFYSSSVNHLYYNPNTRYLPGIDKNSFSDDEPNGSYMANAVPTKALNDPYRSPSGSTMDLTQSCYYRGAKPPQLPSRGDCGNYSSSFKKGPIALTAYYYEYTGTGTPTPGSSAAYVRRDILPSITEYTRNGSRTDCSLNAGKTVATCTYKQEIQNFANWYSYYRTRILTMKTAMGHSFASLDQHKYRVGFSTINSGTSNFIPVADFDVAGKKQWFSRLYSIKPLGGTPLQAALKSVGQYYSGKGMGYGSSDDPVLYSCQSNNAILSTDGFWNGNEASVINVGNMDQTVPDTIPGSEFNPPPATGLTAGKQWPRPYYEGATATGNTLADIAAYYWVRDLRPGMANNVPVNSADPASWQHMTTYTIGLGANGEKAYREDYLSASSGFYADLMAGRDNWPKPQKDTRAAIDDLWHAAVNGHGQYFSAKNPTSLRDSLSKVLESIGSDKSSGSAPAVTTANLAEDNVLYMPSYIPGEWSGDLQSYTIDPSTAKVSGPNWSAQSAIDASSVTADNRKIVTYGFDSSGKEEKGIQFRPSAATGARVLSKLSLAQEALLNTTASPANGADVIAFLRGDRSKEDGVEFRERKTRLGDIVNAGPVVVSTPSRSYNDAGYAAFKEKQKVKAGGSSIRIKTVFQGANDGMLHAFQASDGVESWAYIPGFLFNGPSKLKDLTKGKDFSHRYYVNATPYAGDADFSNTCPDSGCPLPATLSSPDWRTVLVGGLGKGGRGYYALDVTTPTADSESDAAGKVLWEFPNAATSAASGISLTTTAGTASGGFTMEPGKIGYTYGKPLIVKTKRHGWVALVTSGYNNGGDTGGDGHGYLFVLNVRNGNVLHVFDTSEDNTSSVPDEFGNAANPSGLAYINAYVPDAATDMTIEYVYGGDLQGNVWRFDLKDVDESKWRLARLARLVDSSRTVQPVTSAPDLARIVGSAGEKRLVYVGTGQYFGDSDLPGSAGANVHAAQKQTMYGLVDDLSVSAGGSPVIGALRASLLEQVFSGESGARTATKNSIDYSNKKGWYIDLPSSGERVIEPPS